MNVYKRSGNRWTVNELLSLQREYELLEWTVQQIAEKHQRSVEAILYRLESEGFISSWNSARGFDTQQYQNSCSGNIDLVVDNDDETVLDEDCAAEDSEYFDEGPEEEEEEEDDDMSIDEQSDVDKLTERIWNLETNLSEISSMVCQIFETMVSKKSPKRAPLRQR